MEEIKAGEFVRIKDCGRYSGISKIKKIEDAKINLLGKKYYCKMGGVEHFFLKKDIAKHSFNIKDLIEEGDIIKYTPKGIKSIHIDIVRKIKDARSGNETLVVNLYSIGQIDIISIVTKEQFKAMEYEVK